MDGLSGRLESGYRLSASPIEFTPYGATQAQWLHLPSHTETASSGSPQFALEYFSQNSVTTRTELGAWLDRHQTIRGGDFTIYSRVAWAHAFNNSRWGSTEAFFELLPGANFRVYAAQPHPDEALVSAGLKYSFMNGWSLYGKYEDELSRKVSIQSGSVALRKQW